MGPVVKLKYFIVCAIFLVLHEAPAQNPQIDSLELLVKQGKNDTNTVKNLARLAAMFETSDIDSTENLLKAALELSNKINWEEGKAYNLVEIGWCNYLKGDYPKAIQYNLEGLKIAEKSNITAVMSSAYSNIAVVYETQENYQKALENNFKALRLNEKAGNKRRAAVNYGNIGLIYYAMRDYPKALSYYEKAMTIEKEQNNQNGMIASLANMGIVYTETQEYEKALTLYMQALDLCRQTQNGNYLASAYTNVGWLYIKTRSFTKAEEFLGKALSLSKELKLLAVEKDARQFLYELDSTRHNYSGALMQYKKFIELKDSIASEENTREQTRAEMNYEFEKKEAGNKAEQEKKDAVAAAESRKQKIIITAVSGGLVLILILAIVILRSLRINQKKNRIITKQKEMVEHQKELVEEKQKEILDSIHYAKRIQTALLPNERYIGRYLK